MPPSHGFAGGYARETPAGVEKYEDKIPKNGFGYTEEQDDNQNPWMLFFHCRLL